MLVAKTCTGRTRNATLPWEIEHPRGRIVKVTKPGPTKVDKAYTVTFACGCKHVGSLAQVENLLSQ